MIIKPKLKPIDKSILAYMDWDTYCFVNRDPEDIFPILIKKLNEVIEYINRGEKHEPNK